MFNGRIRVSGYNSGGLNTTFLKTVGSCANAPAVPISISSPVAQEIIKLEPKTAAICVSLFAIFNGAGRPGFGWLTDRIQPKNAAITSYVMILMGSLLMLSASESQTSTYLIGFSLFWLSLGAWLAIAPTATLTWFDPQQYAKKNYGVVFTAYGVGALLGPIAASRLRDLFGSCIYAFYPTACLAVLGIIVAVFMLKRN
jgi:MFS family permease